MFRCAAPALFLLAPFLAASQTASRSPEFEAASVKPVPAGTEYGGMRGGPGTGSPGQIHYDATTLRAVVARAYGVQRFQIAGPKWFDDERFDIVAKIATRPSPKSGSCPKSFAFSATTRCRKRRAGRVVSFGAVLRWGSSKVRRRAELA